MRTPISDHSKTVNSIVFVKFTGKKVSPQNGGFIRVTELAPRRFIGKAKPFFFIDKNLSSSQRNLLDNLF